MKTIGSCHQQPDCVQTEKSFQKSRIVDVFRKQDQNWSQLKSRKENQISHRMIDGQQFPSIQQQQTICLIEDNTVQSTAAQGKNHSVEWHDLFQRCVLVVVVIATKMMTIGMMMIVMMNIIPAEMIEKDIGKPNKKNQRVRGIFFRTLAHCCMEKSFSIYRKIAIIDKIN